MANFVLNLPREAGWSEQLERVASGLHGSPLDQALPRDFQQHAGASGEICNDIGRMASDEDESVVEPPRGSKSPQSSSVHKTRSKSRENRLVGAVKTALSSPKPPLRSNFYIRLTRTAALLSTLRHSCFGVPGIPPKKYRDVECLIVSALSLCCS